MADKNVKKPANVKEKVLEVNNLSIQFPIGNGRFFNATKDISFDVYKGEVVGLVGESGSGKSTTAKSILGLLEHSAGSIKISNEMIPGQPSQIKGRIDKWLASKVQMIFQDAKSSLNPRENVFDVIVEGAKNQKLFEKNKAAIQVKTGNEWVEENKKEFKDSIYYNRIKNELSFLNSKSEVIQKFEKDYGKIFTDYFEQKFTLKSVYRTKRSKIRTAKTYCKFAKAQKISLAKLRELMDIDKYVMMKFIKTSNERILVNKILTEKLKHDIYEIEKEYAPIITKEKAKLEKLKIRFKVGKKNLIQRKRDLLKTVQQKWIEYKKETKIMYKEALKNPNSLSVKAKNEWSKFKKEHESSFNKKAFYKEVVKDAMNKVSMSPEYINRFPGEFSGGQAQRIAIARTIAMNSDLIIADEPISALDVSIQAQVINLLKDLIKKQKLTILFIAHDLQVVRYISDRIVVMYKGEIVEQGPANMVYNNPVHPYTQSLVKAVPSIDHPERLKESKAYRAEIFLNFFNYKEIKKDWANVNAKGHMIYGTAEQTARWIKESKKKK